MIRARPPCAWAVEAYKTSGRLEGNGALAPSQRNPRQCKKIEANEKSGHRNHSHSISAHPSLACSRLSIGEDDLASTDGWPKNKRKKERRALAASCWLIRRQT
jgi:hypothetical protein